MKRIYWPAALCGLLILVAFFPLTWLELRWQAMDMTRFMKFLYPVMVTLTFLLYLGFLSAFIRIGRSQNNRLLSFGAILLITISLLYTIYFLWARFYSQVSLEAIETGFVGIFGAVELIFGAGFARMKIFSGKLAGWFLLISGLALVIGWGLIALASRMAGGVAVGLGAVFMLLAYIPQLALLLKIKTE